MNLKHSIKQLEKVLSLLLHEKQFTLKRLASINTVISNKLKYVEKIDQYRRDYNHSNGIRLSHTIPSLMINFSNFIDKMDLSIINEKNAIDRVRMDRLRIEEKLMQQEQKIKAIEVLLHARVKALKIQVDNRSMEADDELASLRQLRSSHE